MGSKETSGEGKGSAFGNFRIFCHTEGATQATPDLLPEGVAGAHLSVKVTSAWDIQQAWMLFYMDLVLVNTNPSMGLGSPTLLSAACQGDRSESWLRSNRAAPGQLAQTPTQESASCV